MIYHNAKNPYLWVKFCGQNDYMRNFDYLKDSGLNDLHRYCRAAEENQVSDPDISAADTEAVLQARRKYR